MKPPQTGSFWIIQRRRLRENNPNPPADPVLQATLQNIASLRNDFAAIGNAADGASPPAQKQSLTNDLAIAAQGAKAAAGVHFQAG